MGFEQLYIHDVLESFITMVDFSNRDLNLNNSTSVQPTNQPTTEQQEVVKKDLPKAIFANMTKFEAKEAGLLDTFIAANSDGDDVLTQEEVESYNAKNPSAETAEYTPVRVKNSIDYLVPYLEIEDLDIATEEVREHFKQADTDNDGKISEEEFVIFHIKNQLWKTRVKDDQLGLNNVQLQGGYYTVQKGDTIEDIAKVFGVSPLDIYNLNKDDISDFTNLAAGQKIKLSGLKHENDEEQIKIDTKIFRIITSKDEKNTKEKIANFVKTQKPIGNLKIFVGMTYEQAEKIGGETLAQYNAITSNTKITITEKMFAQYKKNMYKITSEQMLDFAKDVIGNEFDVEDIKFMVDTFVPTLIDNTNMSKSETAKQTKQNIDNLVAKATGSAKENWQTNSSEISHQFYSDIQSLFAEDLKSENGTYATHKKRLKDGKYTTFEKTQLGLNGELTDEQVELYAKKAAKGEYIVAVIQSLREAINNHDDDQIMVLIANTSSQFFEDPDVQAIVETYGLKSIVDEAKRMFAANSIARNNDRSLGEMNTFVASVYTATLAENADAESFQIFAENHANDIDLIQEVTQVVIDKLPEGEKKTALQTAINNAIETVQQNGGATSSGRSVTKAGNATQSGNAVTGNHTAVGNNAGRYSAADIAQFVTNPQQLVEAKKVADLRYQSETFYKTPSSVVKQPTKSEIQKQQFIALQQEMHARRVKMRASLQSKSLSEVIGVMFDHYNQMPADIKLKFVAHIQALDPDTQCETYIKGSDDLKKFMRKNNAMNNEKMINYFKKHPAELARANKSVQVEYMKAQAEQIKHETGATLTSTLSSQDPKKVSHWHEYPFWNK